MSTSETHTTPTRLLFIGTLDVPQISLVATQDLEAVTYATLSHCWGSSQPFVTLSSNLKTRMDGIDSNTLPRTFKDAITVCRRLQIEYLWIDSICIIQDDKKDWESESRKMGLIYLNSFFTIAATRASHDEEGFLTPIHFERQDLHVYAAEISPGFVIMTHSQADFAGSSFSPLNKRAWVIQERYFARRTIFFSSSGLSWACARCEVMDTGKMNGVSDGVASFSIDDVVSNIESVARLNQHENFMTGRRSARNLDLRMPYAASKYTGWYQLVERYTRCFLTRPTDRLPALSGLVAYIARTTGDSYYAGLWGRAIVEGLPWTSKTPVPSDLYLAPTWSWASVNGPVKYRTPSRIIQTYASVKAILASLSGSNPYGEVSDGSLTLQAPLLLTSGYFKVELGSKEKFDEYSLFTTIDDPWNFYALVCEFNNELQVSHIKWPLTLAVLSMDETDLRYERLFIISALILEQHEHGTYRRIGACKSCLHILGKPPRVFYEHKLDYVKDYVIIHDIISSLPVQEFVIK